MTTSTMPAQVQKLQAADGAEVDRRPPSATILYEEAASVHADALGRVARAYEADGEKRRDLLQDIHVALWKSLAGFDGRCSLRTWVYRIAHNVASNHVLRERRKAARLVDLEALEALPAEGDGESDTDRRRTYDRLLELVQRLKPLDRQVIVLYLEAVEPASISEITGLSVGAVNTRIHRIKGILAAWFHGGVP